MYTQVEKSKNQNNCRPVASSVANGKDIASQGFRFVDNRPSVKTYKNLQMFTTQKKTKTPGWELINCKKAGNENIQRQEIVEVNRPNSVCQDKVTQLTKSYTSKTRRHRNKHMKKMLDGAYQQWNAYNVGAKIFHNMRLIKRFDFIQDTDRVGVPSNKFAKTGMDEGYNPFQLYKPSRDGEIFLLDQIIPFLNNYLNDLSKSSETSDVDSGRLKPGRHLPTTPFGFGDLYPEFIGNKNLAHDITVEIVGPKGTCQNCQAALSQYQKEIQNKYFQTWGGTPIQIKINTRYIKEDGFETAPERYVGFFDKWYGSRRAKIIKKHRYGYGSKSHYSLKFGGGRKKGFKRNFRRQNYNYKRRYGSRRY